MGIAMSRLTRRNLLKAVAVASLGGSTPVAGQPPASKFTLSVNLELMFPRQMPYAERIAVVADQGCQAFSFWELARNQAAAMEGAQRRHGLKCGSITGNGRTGEPAAPHPARHSLSCADETAYTIRPSPIQPCAAEHIGQCSPEV